MTTGRVQVDTASLARAGRELSQVVDQVQATMTRHRAALEPQGEPWGRDELGAPFAAVYVRVEAKAFTAIASYQDQIADRAERLRIASTIQVDLLRRQAASLRLLPERSPPAQ
jgi:hypothetical protein